MAFDTYDSLRAVQAYSVYPGLFTFPDSDGAYDEETESAVVLALFPFADGYPEGEVGTPSGHPDASGVYYMTGA